MSSVVHRFGKVLWIIPAILVVLVAGGVVYWVTISSGPDALVVYCAHDSVFSEPVIEAFEKETGISVVFVPDTEASKSLGLTQRILAEKDSARCDVFWNNQQLGMMDLAEAGVLESYRGTGSKRIPEKYKDKDGLWTGFAARMRVWIVNTNKMEATRAAVVKANLSQRLLHVAFAKPLYGTTRTHFTVLWDVWSGDRLKYCHQELRDRGVLELTGNSTVMREVSAGNAYLGLTDTDDYFVAKDEGQPVAMVPVWVAVGAAGNQTDLPSHSAANLISGSPSISSAGKTAVSPGTYHIVIPNTVAIIKGTKRRDKAQRFVDFLLSKKVELMLAKSKARQIPLGPIDESELPDDVRVLRGYVKTGYPLGSLDKARKECLDWLRTEYGQ